MKDSGFRRISTMSGSYQIEGHASNLWGCDGATSRITFNNNLRAGDDSLNGNHADVIPSSSHSKFDPQIQASEGDSPDDLDFSDEVLKYINHILMEEDVEEKTCMFQESAALEAAEKSFKEVIGEQFTDYQHASNFDETFNKNPDEKLFGLNDFHDYDANILPQSCSQYSYVPSSSSGTIVDSPVSTLRIPDIFCDSQSAMQFKKGVEEASKFLPSRGNLDVTQEGSSNIDVKEERVSRGKKNPYHEITCSLDERSSKQSAVYTESTVSSDIFDKVLLCSGGKNESDLREALNEIIRNTQLNNELMGSNSGNKKKQGSKKVVDMRTLLSICADSVAANDHRAVNDLLKQIRQHANPSGDGMQRLGYYFANGLEARMAGSGTQIYKSLVNTSTSAADILKAYHIYLATCPFRKISNFFANKTIRNLSEDAMNVHIIDFGILYGFQWPCFFQYLARRPGGPPTVRITGIDLPCSGFRPSERVEETGRRLASYAKTFKVPFEFNAIAQKWETIKLEDLKIKNDEFLAVSCLYRFRSLLDETVLGDNCPRNVVLKLIRKMNPVVFVQGIVSGSYNAPFFITRFREALFHYSSFFDMLDANIPREVHERMLLERTVFGREAMNVIACEGGERIERPETYKQWQRRIRRAGFKQCALDKEIVRLARNRVVSSYHKDFMIDEDGQWLLQGWKGRTVYALSSWTPDYLQPH